MITKRAILIASAGVVLAAQGVFGQLFGGDAMFGSDPVSRTLTTQLKQTTKLAFIRRAEEVISVCGFDEGQASRLRLAA
ncbi:MAG TPA: hypothetical protein DDW52_24255, partial [Planctomycetaceae bacterium]|nr:hypothetical protein [Planctomycetaceae bacterium]